MTASLDNLVRTGQLKLEPPAQQELDGLIRSGLARLRDAENTACHSKAVSISPTTRLMPCLSRHCAGAASGPKIDISCSRRLRSP